jgi:nucleoside-diphosphate-sugar epimerase
LLTLLPIGRDGKRKRRQRSRVVAAGAETTTPPSDKAWRPLDDKMTGCLGGIKVRILFIGGTNMSGPFAVRDLIDWGHDVWLLHRTHAQSPLLSGATQIQGDKAALHNLRAMLEALRLDVVVHMVAFTETDARQFLQSICGIAPRAVVISSIDVYRAYGRLHRTEPGSPDPVPLSEDAPLRSMFSIDGAKYEKRAVEQIAQGDPKLPCTILRYPAVYGPGDRRYRLSGWIRRMDDGRPVILMGKGQADWRFTHGYVENVARALALAIATPAAAGRIYNVGEQSPTPWAQWARAVGKAAGWTGEVKVVSEDRLPEHLSEQFDFRQDWVVDTSRIRRELHFDEPIQPDECLRRAIAWERAAPSTRDQKQFNYEAEDAAIAGLDAEK